MKKLRFKKLHKDAVIPHYASPGAAGLDLTAVDRSETQYYTEYDTGLAVEIPAGHAGLLFPRSSVSGMDMMLKNSVGVIDSDYRGPVKLRFQRVSPAGPFSREYLPGERVGQLVIVPLAQLAVEEADELSGTARGAGGFGSTGAR